MKAKLYTVLRRLLFVVCLIGFLTVPKYASSQVTQVGASAAADVAEQKTVFGKVTDEKGNPVGGVRVWLKDSAVATLTDNEGNYSLSYTGNYGFINFSFIGYKTNEQPFVPGKVLNVQMKLATEDIEEVVVVGYGVQKKASVVGAISSIEVANIKAPVGKISNQLAGNIAGVISIQRSGEPGEGAGLWIRGLSTFTNANPLVLVDGIERDLDLVDPEDIQELSILKDASATAIYGVRGANGVILITTRSGHEGRGKVSLKFEAGIVKPTRTPKMVNSMQWAEMWNDAEGQIIYTQDDIEKYRTGVDPDLYPNVNWVDELYKSVSSNQRVNINVSGGGSTAKYYVAGGFYNEDGLFKKDNMNKYNTSVFYRKFNFRANVDLQILKHTKLNVNLATTFERKNEPGTAGGTIWNYALRMSPNAFPMTFSGTEDLDYTENYFPGPKVGEGYNPYVLLTQSGYVQRFWNNAQSTFGITQDFGEYITPGLTADVKFSFDASNYSRHQRTKTPHQYLPEGRDEEGNLILLETRPGDPTLKYSETESGWRKTYLEASLHYARQFNKHNVSGLFLYQHSEKHLINSARASDSEASQAALPYRHQGIAGRVTYDYDSRYFIEGNFGYNGSENFSPGRRFGFFPSVAGGWLISQESFFSSVKPVVDMLKLRISWGKAGNDQIGGDRRFIYQETIATGDNYIFGKDYLTTITGLYLGDYPNPFVGWETSTKFNVGLDLSLFSKLRIEANYFHEYRKGIFLPRASVPLFVGLRKNPYANIARVENQGYDISLDYRDKFGEFDLTVRGNLTYARNVVLEQDEPGWLYDYLNRTGQSRYKKFGYVADGLFRDQDDIDSWPKQNTGSDIMPGDIKYLDLNGDGVVDNYDMKPMGYTDIPEIVYGFGFTAKWRSWDLSAFFKGIAHVTFSRKTPQTIPFSGQNRYEANVMRDVYNNYWSERNPDPNAKYPRLTKITNLNNSQESTYWLTNGNYLRLENIEIGYSLPAKISNKLKIEHLRFYIQGRNLVTWSKFKLWDPDLQTGPTTYPPISVLSFGISFGF